MVLPQLRVKDFLSSNSSSSGTGFVFRQQKAGENSCKPVFSFGLGSSGPFSFSSTKKDNTGADDGGVNLAWNFKVARLDVLGGIPPKFEH